METWEHIIMAEINENQPLQSPSHSLPPEPQLPSQSPSTPPQLNE